MQLIEADHFENFQTVLAAIFPCSVSSVFFCTLLTLALPSLVDELHLCVNVSITTFLLFPSNLEFQSVCDPSESLISTFVS